LHLLLYVGPLAVLELPVQISAKLSPRKFIDQHSQLSVVFSDGT
jgi:hypothetical protein